MVSGPSLTLWFPVISLTSLPVANWLTALEPDCLLIVLGIHQVTFDTGLCPASSWAWKGISLGDLPGEPCHYLQEFSQISPSE